MLCYHEFYFACVCVFGWPQSQPLISDHFWYYWYSLRHSIYYRRSLILLMSCTCLSINFKSSNVNRLVTKTKVKLAMTSSIHHPFSLLSRRLCLLGFASPLHCAASFASLQLCLAGRLGRKAATQNTERPIWVSEHEPPRDISTASTKQTGRFIFNCWAQWKPLEINIHMDI